MMEDIRPTSDEQSPRPPLKSYWETAALWQFLYMFSDALKVPRCDDTEILEHELTHPTTAKLLPEIQVALLKNVSSQRGLTIDQFDDYTRRQYLAKKPELNPFGTDELPTPFNSFDSITRVRVLYQLCRWIIYNTERFREKMGNPENKEALEWRVDPIGWDAKGNTYYALDNNRLYRRTEPPIPNPPSKSKSKSKSRRKSGGRASKRRKVNTNDHIDSGDGDGENDEAAVVVDAGPLAKMDWQCVCSSLTDYQELISRFSKSKDLDEKALAELITSEIIPIFEKEEAKRLRKAQELEREESRLALLANRKRSSRIDEKFAKQQEMEVREAELRQKQVELDVARKEAKRLAKEEEERKAKLAERERRLEQREIRTKARGEEKKRLIEMDAEGADVSSSGSATTERKSSRMREKKKSEWEAEEYEWIFDCVCGIHGTNYDDGTLSIACDKCGIWQHIKCLNLTPKAQDEDWVCERCILKEKQSQSPRLTLKLRFSRPSPNASAEVRATTPTPGRDLGDGLLASAHNGTTSVPQNELKVPVVNGVAPPNQHEHMVNGTTSAPPYAPPTFHYDTVNRAVPPQPQQNPSFRHVSATQIAPPQKTPLPSASHDNLTPQNMPFRNAPGHNAPLQNGPSHNSPLHNTPFSNAPPQNPFLQNPPPYIPPSLNLQPQTQPTLHTPASHILAPSKASPTPVQNLGNGQPPAVTETLRPPLTEENNKVPSVLHLPNESIANRSTSSLPTLHHLIGSGQTAHDVGQTIGNGQLTPAQKAPLPHSLPVPVPVLRNVAENQTLANGDATIPPPQVHTNIGGEQL